MRLTILMPAIGYLVLLNHRVFEELSRILGSAQQVSEPEPARLLLVYFGTFFLGVASAIFASSCPTPCRRYDNAVDYANAESAFFTANAAIVKKMINGHLDRVPLSDRYVSLWQIEDKLEITNDNNNDPGRRLEATYFPLDQHWHQLDPDRPFIRAICRTFYDIGILLLLIPTAWTFYEVLLFTWRLLRS